MKQIPFKLAILILFIVASYTMKAQSSNDKVHKEISKTLDAWNSACKNGNLDLAMSMFDESDGIMVIGSAKGEINKGKEEIRKWAGQIFSFAGFSWEMSRIDIDSNGKTAWVFMDGKMIVDFHKGGQKITPYRFTGIMVKKKGIWKWRLFDGSVPEK